MKLKSLSVLFLGGLLLTACGEPTVEDYVENDKLFEKVAKECAELGQLAGEEEKCVRAAEAKVKRMKNRVEELKDDMLK